MLLLVIRNFVVFWQERVPISSGLCLPFVKQPSWSILMLVAKPFAAHSFLRRGEILTLIESVHGGSFLSFSHISPVEPNLNLYLAVSLIFVRLIQF